MIAPWIARLFLNSPDGTGRVSPTRRRTFWLNRKRASSPAELLTLGDQLLRHARTMRPDWPGEAERAADLAVHQRVAEALRAPVNRLR